MSLLESNTFNMPITSLLPSIFLLVGILETIKNIWQWLTGELEVIAYKTFYTLISNFILFMIKVVSKIFIRSLYFDYVYVLVILQKLLLRSIITLIFNRVGRQLIALGFIAIIYKLQLHLWWQVARYFINTLICIQPRRILILLIISCEVLPIIIFLIYYYHISILYYILPATHIIRPVRLWFLHLF